VVLSEESLRKSRRAKAKGGGSRPCHRRCRLSLRPCLPTQRRI